MLRYDTAGSPRCYIYQATSHLMNVVPYFQATYFIIYNYVERAQLVKQARHNLEGGIDVRVEVGLRPLCNDSLHDGTGEHHVGAVVPQVLGRSVEYTPTKGC